jgi:transcriptional regulator with XRE-family HTH domain
MKERLMEFLRYENKSSAQLAEDIGVQPSSISHILSGRNNPSLDFVLKMFEKYEFLSTDWFLFGNGPMYKEERMDTLFYNSETVNNEKSRVLPFNESEELPGNVRNNEKEASVKSIDNKDIRKEVVVRKIVWFYEDNSFEEYFPSS